MQFIGEKRMESDFDKIVTPTNFFHATSTYVSFYDNKYFDFSAFSFVPVEEWDFYPTEFASYTIYTNF